MIPLQDPSHIALEVAMQTHPNMVLLAEDVRAKRWSLHDIVREISDVVQARSDMGKEFGTVLVSTKSRLRGSAACSRFAHVGHETVGHAAPGEDGTLSPRLHAINTATHDL